MTEILKKLIEAKINRKVKTRGDCEFISNAILETLDVDISYSTIKRLYGLNIPTTPNIKTLNVLAQFVGYKNYLHFTQNYKFEDTNNLNFQVYKTVSKEKDIEIIDLVKDTKKSFENFPDFIIVLIRELLHNEKYELVNELFKLDALKYSSFTYSEILYIGNSIGLLLQNKKKINSILLSNINFLDCVYLTFVDYSNLNNYYGKSTQFVSAQKTNIELKIFSKALLELKNYLNQKAVSTINNDLLYSKELHPILCSRLLSLNFLASTKTDEKTILNNYFKAHEKRLNLLDYSHELFTTGIITKNTFLMNYLINKINLDMKITFLYQKYHLNSFYLMCLFYYRIINDEVNEIKFHKLFSLDNCTVGYADFIKTLYLVYKYNISTVNVKNELKKEYNKLIIGMKYSRFDENFIMNYFLS